MKKTIGIIACLLFLLFSISYVTFAENSVRLGIDTLGKLSTDYFGSTLSKDVTTGVSLSWEYINPINENVDIGPGIECQLYRKVNGASNSFCYFPIYWFARYNLNNTGGQKIYLVGKIGYDYLLLEKTIAGATIKGGVYYGVGAGTIINQNIEVEALYSACDGSISDSYSSASLNYSRLSIVCGFKF